MLDFLSHTVHTNADVAEAILSSIDSDHELDSDCTITCSTYSFQENGNSPNGLLVGNDHVDGCHHHTDGYILVEMLSVPGFFVEVSQVFERALILGCIGLHSVARIRKVTFSKVKC